MKLTLLCNAGLALETEGAMVLVDVPNGQQPPFYTIPDALWQQIFDRIPPYDRVCGLWITHDHPDHCHRQKLMAYHARWPQVPVFLPDYFPATGKVHMGPFVMQYRRVDHAPIVDPPVHVVTLVQVGERTIYLPADAALDPQPHREFLQGRVCDAAVWNSMYLSRPENRQLLRETAKRNFIYHMPEEKPDSWGLWKKLAHNLQRYGPELQSVTVLDQYPSTVELT